MSIPGANLLAMASRLIAFQTVQWRRNLGVALQPDGNDSFTFAPPAPIRGSVQAVPREAIVRAGLDLEQSYFMFYTKTLLQDLKRDKAPDVLTFGGRTYNVEANTNWKIQDGWIGSIVVDAGPA